MKLKVRKEVWIGIVIISSLLVLYWGINYLKGSDIFNKEADYYAIYDEIEGLSLSNPVQVNGFTVGSVRGINFMPDHSGRIIIKMTIVNQEIKFPINTLAKITSLDLLGSKSINLVLSENEEFHKVGDTLTSSVEASLSDEVNKQILPLKLKAEDLLASMDTVIQVVRMILNQEARENLSASFKNIKNAMGTFEVVAMRVDTMISEEKAKLSSIMTNFNSISNNLRNNNENITFILDNIAYITDSIAASNVTQTINNASIAFKDAASIMEKIDQGTGTIGQLVNNDSLYWNLENSARDLDLLLKDLEEHPGRYVRVSVFGGKDKESKKREKEQKKLDREKRKQAKKE